LDSTQVINTQVGTKLIFENEKVKVWELVLNPGEEIVLHRHALEYMFYVITGSTIAVYDVDDQQIINFKVASGDTMAFCPDGDFLRCLDGAISDLPAIHSAKNIGESIYREILVETKA
jgi:hypothetical protein